MEDKTVIVIGAVNMDICGRPAAAPNMYDSNPGKISLTPGGVGRNIAHNLCLMGLNVKFIAAIGDDFYGDGLYRSCAELGMDMHLSRRVCGGRSSSYLYVTDDRGEMLIGVSDTDISDSVNPGYLALHLDEINSADAVCIDGNLNTETVSWIAENVTAPLYADPVSVTKAERLKPALKKLCGFKPNALEAMSMTGEKTPEKAAESLVTAGVKRVFVTLGKDGVIASDGTQSITAPCKQMQLVNTTGCGDAATAAIIKAGVYGMSLAEAVQAAMTAAAQTAECAQTVNPKLHI